MNGAALVLTLGKQERNQELLASALEAAGYEVRTETNPRTVTETLESETEPSLLLVDIDGYTEQIWEICDRCEERSVPVLLVASADVDRVEREAAGHGVHSVLGKPLDKDGLERAIESMLES